MLIDRNEMMIEKLHTFTMAKESLNIVEKILISNMPDNRMSYLIVFWDVSTNYSTRPMS